MVTHRRLPDRKGMVSVAGGWHAHVGILEDVLARPRAARLLVDAREAGEGIREAVCGDLTL